MLDKDHVLTSEAFYILALNILKSPKDTIIKFTNTFPQALLIGCGIWLGSQLPDMDSKTSKISQYTKPLSTIISKFGHHGITHSLFGLAFIFILNIILLPIWLNITNINIMSILWGITIGYALHIVEDAFSKAGVIWLFPFYPAYHKWKYNIYVRSNVHTKFRYKTGGVVEKVIRYIDIIIVIIGILRYLLLY